MASSTTAWRIAASLWLAAVSTLGAADASPWRAQPGVLPAVTAAGDRNLIRADRFRLFTVEAERLRTTLASAPEEALTRRSAADPAILVVPRPDGTLERFAIERTPVMHPELARKFPKIQTYAGRSLDRPEAQGRFDFTEFGFHAQVLAADGSYYVDPYYHGRQDFYMSHFKKDAWCPPSERLRCLAPVVDPALRGQLERILPAPDVSSGPQLRTVRLALACTGEYAAFFGGTARSREGVRLSLPLPPSPPQFVKFVGGLVAAMLPSALPTMPVLPPPFSGDDH